MWSLSFHSPNTHIIERLLWDRRWESSILSILSSSSFQVTQRHIDLNHGFRRFGHRSHLQSVIVILVGHTGHKTHALRGGRDFRKQSSASFTVTRPRSPFVVAVVSSLCQRSLNVTVGLSPFLWRMGLERVASERVGSFLLPPPPQQSPAHSAAQSQHSDGGKRQHHVLHPGIRRGVHPIHGMLFKRIRSVLLLPHCIGSVPAVFVAIPKSDCSRVR